MAEYTQGALKVLTWAQEEARQLGYPFVQREQLFLGLLHDGTISRILEALGTDVENIREEVKSRLVPGLGAPEGLNAIGLLPTAEQVFRQRSQTAAALLGDSQIGPQHILLGFLLEQHGVVAEVLASKGITQDRVLGTIKRLGS